MKTDADHLALATKLAQALGPLGVKRVKIAGVELEFHEPTPAPLLLPTDKPTKDDESTSNMERESPADPLNDRMTFGGAEPPSWGGGARKKKAAAKDWPELDTEGQT